MTKIQNYKHSVKNRKNSAFGSFKICLPRLGRGICFQFHASCLRFESLRLCQTGSTSGFTLLEVVYASAIAGLAVLALYSMIMIGYAMICANQQRLDAEALAFDQTLKIFNTYDFANAVLATSLPPVLPPAASVLPGNSEIRTMITPAGNGTNAPYKWDVEVRVKRDRFWPGGKTVTLTNDLIYRVTRYAVARN